MQVVLVMFRGGGDRRSFSITRDVTVIGRREDCDFRIPLGEISRKHCRLIKDGESLRIEDLGSSNGTHVNGVRIQEAELNPGDTLKVGSVVFVVQVDGVPSDDQLNPAPEAAGPESDTATGENELVPSADGESAGEFAPVAESSEVEELAEAQSYTAPVAEDDIVDLEEVPAEEEAPIADAAAEGDYDPMAVLTADPESSSLGSAMEDEGIAEDLISELEQQEQHGKSHQA